jgi:glycosyltransferase involved in cell wall biosynthesis
MAIESALRLKGQGLDVCFVAGAGPVDDRLIHAGIECHQVGDYDILSDPNRLRAASSGIWNFRAARRVSECLARRDPLSTIIHVHGWAKALSPSIGPVVTSSEAAHVYTLHDYFLGCPNGGFYDYRKNEICTRHALGLECLTTRCDSRAESHKAWRVARQTVLKAVSGMPKQLREIIYLAPEQLSILGSYLPADARWHHLPNPTGPQPAQRIAVEKNSLFLFIGRLSPEKGALVAARAARLADVPIAFCGDGRSREAVVQANPDAKMLGWIAKDELGSWMTRARCLVFPSLWYEGYPLVVADALRAGVPVIVSKSSIAASSISDGVNGIHVAAGDIRAWAEAMTRLNSDDLVHRFGQAAFRAGKQLLDYDEYMSRLMGIYEKALSRKRGDAEQGGDIVP